MNIYREERHLPGDQEQKLESLGDLSGHIAHDFNNLLSTIYGYVDMARVLLDPSQVKSAEYLDKALLIFGRTKNVTDQLLTFSRSRSPVRKSGDLPALLQQTFCAAGPDIETEFDLPCDLWTCEFDAKMMRQVFDNLLLNAKQAMPDGGVITITAANAWVANRNTGLEPGHYVKLTVGDTGTGIPYELLPKIFEPFFTTKKGASGLGLAICFSIIKGHGGIITAASQPPGGAVFTIHLPANVNGEPVRNRPLPF